ncbi:hypothetical protein Vadar_013800 [Vaccinium darrowii]|uniref:Uncharacterized protein n=1 Tax=Vaccinium darrowii TaxID=229202 RepID=A0ACB7XYW9_9ERIC|nr:hypothetical protein Vadar_013800 [Vaccinium darrowii]
MGIEKLPEDLLAEILWRLPVKLLLRSKSVCKKWYSLIENPSFISLQHNRTSIAATENNCLLVNQFLGGGNGNIILSFVPHETPTEDIEIFFAGLDVSKKLVLLGPCNGVICLTRQGFNSTIVMCNPSIREFRVLPEPSYKKDYLANLGFGFDPFTNAYKVVKFGYLNPDFSNWEFDERIEIYDLSTDSWREVDTVSPVEFGFRCCYEPCTSWNGDCYWYAYCTSDEQAIFRFRMSDEVFDEIPVPDVILLDNSSERKLFILDDSLALVLYPSGWVIPEWFPGRDFSLNKCFDIWVMAMDEQRVEVSWTKRYSIGPLHAPNYALGFRRNGEFLLESGGGQMMLYHLDTQQIKEYQLYGHSPPECLQVLPYVESLVSVKRHNDHEGHNDLHI